MRTELNQKIINQVNFLHKMCFELHITEYRYFLRHCSPKITTSGEIEKLTQRIQLEELNSQIDCKSLRNEFFINLAKLFDKTKKTKSIPKLIESLTKNEHLFNTSECEIINKAKLGFETDIKVYKDIIDLIIDHRNQCLAHPDKMSNCMHLNGIKSNTTENIINLVVVYLDKLATIFNTEHFKDEHLKQVKDKMFSDFYNTIKKMES